MAEENGVAGRVGFAICMFTAGYLAAGFSAPMALELALVLRKLFA